MGETGPDLEGCSREEMREHIEGFGFCLRLVILDLVERSGFGSQEDSNNYYKT